MTEEIVLATRNKHKISEIKDMLRGLDVRITSLAEYPEMPEVVEDGETLEYNASKKAKEIALHLNKWALADDTGLEVAHLNGEPGVYSARWAGPECSYLDNNKKLLDRLKDVPENERGALFRTVIALSDPAGKVTAVDGSVRGKIAERMRGENGFGYDPLFIDIESGKTFAEMTAGEKNGVSHRARALAKAKELIQKLFGV
jgi:XTP/dITP diphosphohydrolase